MDKTLSPSCSEDEIFVGVIDKNELEAEINEKFKSNLLNKSLPVYASYRKRETGSFQENLRPECDQYDMDDFREKGYMSSDDGSREFSIAESLSSVLSRSAPQLDGDMSSYLTCKTSNDTMEMYSVGSQLPCAVVDSPTSATDGDVSSDFSSPKRLDRASINRSLELDATDDCSGSESDESVDMNNTAEEYALFIKYGPDYDDRNVRRRIDAQRAQGIKVDPLEGYELDQELLDYIKRHKDKYGEEPLAPDDETPQTSNGEAPQTSNGEAPQPSEDEGLQPSQDEGPQPSEDEASQPCNKSGLKKKSLDVLASCGEPKSHSGDHSVTSAQDGLQSSQVECDINWSISAKEHEVQECSKSSDDQHDDSEHDLSGVSSLSSSSDKENSAKLAEVIDKERAMSGGSYQHKTFKKSDQHFKKSSGTSYKLPTPIKTQGNPRKNPFKTPLPKSSIPKPTTVTTPRFSPSSKGIVRSPSFSRKPFTPISPSHSEGKVKLPFYMRKIESPVAKYMYENRGAAYLLGTNSPSLRMKGDYKKVVKPNPAPVKLDKTVVEATNHLEVIVSAEDDSTKVKGGPKLQMLSQTVSPQVRKVLGRQKGHLGDILAATGGKTNRPVRPSLMDKTVEVTILQEKK